MCGQDVVRLVVVSRLVISHVDRVFLPLERE